MHNKQFSHFLILWSGQLVSSIGSGLTAFALGIYVFQLTDSATSYSLILLAAFLPMLLLKPIGGTLSDRINRRSLMILGDLGSALGLIFIIVMLAAANNNLWVIYAGTILSSLFVALQNPAYKASVTDFVSEEFYSKASGLMQLAESAKFLISPIIAGFLLKIFNIKLILTIDIVTFLFAIITTLWVNTNYKTNKTRTHQHFLNDFNEGFKYLFQHRAILWLLIIVSIITFFVGLLQALLGPMILSFTNPQTFGVSQTVATSGMLVGSFFIGMFAKNNKKLSILSMGLFVCGISFSLMGIAANIIVITTFGFLFFLLLPFVNTSLDVLVRSNVDNKIQGRIWSIVSLISQLGMVIAFGIAGYLADQVFNPLLSSSGKLASSIGEIIGTGPGRGIGLIFILSGLFVAAIGLMINQLIPLQKLEKHENIKTDIAPTVNYQA